jgi:bifunctional DNase/RNase
MRNSDGALISLIQTSDAIALALRADCPIHVNREVISLEEHNADWKRERNQTSQQAKRSGQTIGEAGDLLM